LQIVSTQFDRFYSKTNPIALFKERLSTVLLKQGLKPLEALAKPQKEGVETRPFWNPMHVQPAFVQEKSVLNGVAMGLFERDCVCHQVTI